MPPVRADEGPVPDARAAASAPPAGLGFKFPQSGGELARMVRTLELGESAAPLARTRELRVKEEG